MTIQTSKTQALSIGRRSAKAMATFTALTLIALSVSVNPAHAAPQGHVDVRINLGGHHEDQRVRADPIFRRINTARARIDNLLDRRAISRFEARRLDQHLDEISFDARQALQGRRTDRRLLASAEMRLDDVTDRLDDTRFRRVVWYR